MDYPERAHPEINLLLLGETGVGKSTFINAFANYLNFPEFEDAKQNEPYCLIPTSFEVTDASKNSVTVTFGSDSNESKNILKGESATQTCRDYVFPVGNTSIRFIDTPGIGDTRGIERDKENLENILSAIGAHDHLNAICILLNPNNPRLTASFEFVVTQLLSQLEKSAASNIVFVYTKSRGSDFTPGDTIVPIKQLLFTIKNEMGVLIPHDARNNVFCLDNETFRFMLAARKNVQFGNRERRGFEDSWEASVEECERLMKYVISGPHGRGLKPYNTKNTISISEARRMIEALKIPTQEIAKAIQMNIALWNEEEKRVKIFDGDIRNLAGKCKISIIETKKSELPEPHCVCTSSKCRKHVKLSSGITYTHYPQISYTFRVNNVVGNTIRDAIFKSSLLYTVSIFNWNGNCKICECSWKEHMVENYKIEIIERVDDSLKKELDKKKGSKEIQKEIVDELQRRLKNMDREQTVIMETTAKFGYFLRENAIIPYNDSFERYIKVAIENEETKKLDSIRNEQIKRYKQMLEDYKQIKMDFEKAIARGGKKEKVTTDTVYKLIEQLYQLPIFGEELKERCSIQDHADRKAAQRIEVIHRGKESSFGAKTSAIYSYIMSYFR